MKELALQFEVISEEKAEKTATPKNRRQRWLLALLFSSLSGVFVGLTGLFISGLNLFGFIEKTSRLNSLGTLLIAIAFPLVMFGAHALDKISEIEKGEKRKAISYTQQS